MPEAPINVVIAGLGGQGVLTCSDILAEAAFRAGHDVKKSEIHGMSQRGGSVTSDVRLGSAVLSPMVPSGEADFLVVVSPDQTENVRHQLKPGGVLLTAAAIDSELLPHKRSVNVALLGMLSTHLPITADFFTQAIVARMPEKLHAINLEAFALGRQIAEQGTGPEQQTGNLGAGLAPPGVRGAATTSQEGKV